MIDRLRSELEIQKVRADHDWYRFTASADGTEATVSIYDEISWYAVAAEDFARELDALAPTVRTINLRINSPGGNVFDGHAIANRLRAHPAKVNVTVDGVAASIASVIAMAGDTVTMGVGAMMMIHNPSVVVRGNSRDMREVADLLDKFAADSLAPAYAAKAGNEPADWLDAMAAETWYSGPEAVAAGLADSVVEPPAGDDGQNAMTAAHDLTAYGWRYAGREHAPDPAAQSRRTRSLAAVARIRTLRKEI